MQTHDRTQENAPQQGGQSAEGEKQQARRDYRHVVVPGNPHVELIFREVWYVVGQCGCVVVHGSARQNPAHV